LSFNSVSGSGKIGIIASGVSALYVKEAVQTVRGFGELFTLFRVGTVYPFPEKAALSFLKGIDRLIVVEELDPYLEEQILQLIGKTHLPVDVYGKKNGFFPVSGEYNVDIVIDGINSAIAAFGESLRLFHAPSAVSREKIPPLPVRAPTLCAGCMHRTVFYAFKQAAKQIKKEFQTDTIFSGDIGCYTLGNAYPLNTVDTCLCMGAGISIARGLFPTNPEAKHVAFIGDSTFFHSGIPAIINAVYNGADITLAVLDNRTTAMTGHQPHPGVGLTALGSASRIIEIADVVRSCGVESVKTVNTVDTDSLESCVKAAKKSMNFKGPSVIVFKGKCVGITKPDKYYKVKSEDCTGCGFCIKELGCPAINLSADKPVIQDSCNGCGLCAQICPSQAICIGGVKL
jgi:indolepyruvate ferredoxin oxidoreductase alpha subunit